MEELERALIQIYILSSNSKKQKSYSVSPIPEAPYLFLAPRAGPGTELGLGGELLAVRNVARVPLTIRVDTTSYASVKRSSMCMSIDI